MKRFLGLSAILVLGLATLSWSSGWDSGGAWNSLDALLAKANTWTGTQTIEQIDLGADGVRFTNDSDGAVTLLGLGGGSDEDLTINLDDTSNTVALSSSTGVTSISAGSIGFATTGILTGKVGVISKSANYTVGTDAAAEAYGYWVEVTSAATITLPAVAQGMSVCVYSTTAAAVSLDANASDRIVLDGTALDDGDKVTSASAAGDFICVYADSADGWRTVGRNGTWTDGGA